jgi:hypothetical protein
VQNSVKKKFIYQGSERTDYTESFSPLKKSAASKSTISSFNKNIRQQATIAFLLVQVKIK